MKKLFLLGPLFFYSIGLFGQKNIFDTKVSNSERTITFESNIYNVKVRFKNPGKNYYQDIGIITENKLTHRFSEIYPSQLSIEFYGDHVETQVLKISRVLKNYFNPFSPKSYIISEKFRTNFIEMEYKDEYMKKKFEEIVNSQNSKDFENYIYNFPNSKLKVFAINKRDSLELSYAIALKNEKAIETYISKFQSSKFLSEAIAIKKEFEDARIAFENAKKVNDISSYETFIAKFPKSIEYDEAHILLVNAAEKDALTKNKLEVSLKYIDKYLIKFSSFLTKEEIQAKNLSIKIALDKQIILENLDEKNKYDSYSKIWKLFKEINSKYKDNIENLGSEDLYRRKISNEIIFSLSKLTNEVSQVNFLKKAKIDFPNFPYPNIDDTETIEINEFLYRIMYYSSNTNETILKLYNQNFLPFYSREKYRGLGYLAYKGNERNAFSGSNYEEIKLKKNITSDPIFEFARVYKNEQLLAEIKFTVNGSRRGYETEEIFYDNGKKIYSSFSDGNSNYYSYEFENGINLSLKELENKIAEAEKESKLNNFEKALNILNNECKNKYPKNIKENIRLENTVKLVNQEKENYKKKEEEKKEQDKINYWLSLTSYDQNKKNELYKEYLTALENKFYDKAIELISIYIDKKLYIDNFDYTDDDKIYVTRAKVYILKSDYYRAISDLKIYENVITRTEKDWNSKESLYNTMSECYLKIYDNENYKKYKDKAEYAKLERSVEHQNYNSNNVKSKELNLAGSYKSNEGDRLTLRSDGTGNFYISNVYLPLGRKNFTWRASNDQVTLTYKSDSGYNETKWLYWKEQNGAIILDLPTMSGPFINFR
jgi:hypothetical protein